MWGDILVFRISRMCWTCIVYTMHKFTQVGIFSSVLNFLLSILVYIIGFFSLRVLASPLIISKTVELTGCGYFSSLLSDLGFVCHH